MLGIQAVADIIRTTLGPRAMLKMLLDASGGGLRKMLLSGRYTHQFGLVTLLGKV